MLRENARPELTSQVYDMDSYDVIFLEYPNWWGTMPMPVFTFLKLYDFSGKTIIPFCTHEGSGMGHSESDIKKLCLGTKVEKGIPIRGGSMQKKKFPNGFRKYGFDSVKNFNLARGEIKELNHGSDVVVSTYRFLSNSIPTCSAMT